MSKIKAIHTLKESIKEQKFIAGESEDHITEWSQQIEGSLSGRRRSFIGTQFNSKN